MSEDSTAPVHLLVNTDEMTEEELLDAIDGIPSKLAEMDEEERQASSFKDMAEAVEYREQATAGVWYPLEQFPGRIKVAPYSRSAQHLQAALREYKIKKNKTDDDIIPPLVLARLRCESMFERSLMGWSGVMYKGQELPFDLRAVWKMWDFFGGQILSRALALDTNLKKAVEAAIPN